MLTIRAMSNGRGYSAKHLQHKDYYAEGERVVGQWQGVGAQRLGLSGDVLEKDFEAVRQGLHPETGEYLRPRHSTDRVAADGSVQSHGRSLYDFTFSAPKSVSVMAQVAGDRRLVAAHHRAVDEALLETESQAGARVRQELANSDRPTANLVIAVYQHDTSRQLDPQLHTHAVAGNLTFDAEENRWKALQARGIYDRRDYLTEVYRNVLAGRVRELGYEIEHRRDDHGRDCGFELQGVSQEIITLYSQRSQERDQAIEEFRRTQGRHPTDNEIAVLVRETRDDKLMDISTAEVHERQQARLTPEQSRSLHDVLEQALTRTQSHARERAVPSLAYAEEHVFERVTVERDYKLMAEALRIGRGHIELAELKAALRTQERNGVALRSGIEISTQASLEREKAMIAAVNGGIDRYGPLGGQSQFTVSSRLSPEQKQAVEFVLASRDLAVNVCGAAGAGKTAMLEELGRGLEHAGRPVLAVAPTMSAVEELRKVGFAKATTIDRMLLDQAQGEQRGKIIIVDEAGMVSGRQMSELLELARNKQHQIVFSGDTRQIHSVEAYDALRILEQESNLKSVWLTTVRRQTVPEYREAIQELRRNPESGFEKLEQMGAVRQVPWLEKAAAVTAAWREAQAGGKQVLIVCATHEEIASVTSAIRLERRAAGELDHSVTVDRHVPLNYTAAQKSEPRNFSVGQAVVFTRPSKDIRRHETLEVVRVEAHAVIARNESGVERELSWRNAKRFEVYERHPIEISPNDQLLLTANRREAGFHATNGETVIVQKVDERGRIHLADGRVLPGNYKQLDHGYAVTAHKSQGKSVDGVVISADAMSRQLFYVAASRGRSSVTVVTSDKDLLRASVGRSDERQSASELVRNRTVRIAVLPQQGRDTQTQDRDIERG